MPNLFLATFGIYNLVFDEDKLDGAIAIENIDVDYNDASLNMAIERVTASPQSEARLRNNFTPSGNVGNTKIISIHTNKDNQVFVEQQSDYANRVNPQNLTVGIVVEDTPSHCDFSDAEMVSAWESLRLWIDGNSQPSVGDIQSLCEHIEVNNIAPGPCRYESNYSIQNLDTRIRPRS